MVCLLARPPGAESRRHLPCIPYSAAGFRAEPWAPRWCLRLEPLRLPAPPDGGPLPGFAAPPAPSSRRCGAAKPLDSAGTTFNSRSSAARGAGAPLRRLSATVKAATPRSATPIPTSFTDESFLENKMAPETMIPRRRVMSTMANVSGATRVTKTKLREYSTW